MAMQRAGTELILALTLLLSPLAWSEDVATALANTRNVAAAGRPEEGGRAGASRRADLNELEEQARAFLRELIPEGGKKLTAYLLADWDYENNLTDHNLQIKLKVSEELFAVQKELWRGVMAFPWRSFKDPDTRRQMKLLVIFVKTASLPGEDLFMFEILIDEMKKIHSTAKICDYKNKTKCDLSNTERENILTQSQDAAELRHVWVEWRRATGEKIRGRFQQYVALSNEAAALNNLRDNSEMWLEEYEDPNFREELERLWQQLRPLHLQLHAYVRRQLRLRYGEALVSRQGPIPDHLLGNGRFSSFSKPYPEAQDINVTYAMLEQGYTPELMFRLAEKFFTSLNMSAMPPTFWQRSILEKPADREIVCHGSAWDFFDGENFRIKMCTQVNMGDLLTALHEMGHVQYFLQYKDQPIVYRQAANPGLNEVVGDVMALSVSTPKHLRKVGLLDGSDADDSAEATLNFLYQQALRKVNNLPWSYLVDLWRWDVFSGRITPDEYNCQWWKLREKYEGVEPPVDRSENDFDPGSIHHIAADVPYISYFVSGVIEFQIHRALCIEAGEFDPKDPAKPLHSCDIYGSTAAGNKLKAMLRLGRSKPWPEALEIVTGSRQIDASAMLDYFRPLAEWLEAENRRTGQILGWEPTQRKCVSTRDELN